MRKILLFILIYIFSTNLFSQSDSLYIPNAFSPNSDGNNDYVKVYTDEEFLNFNFEIYSNYGELVFKSDNPDEVWTGGNFYYPEPTVFQYKIEYIFKNKLYRETKYGHIVLIR